MSIESSLTPLVSTGSSPDIGSLSMYDQHTGPNDGNSELTEKPTTSIPRIPAAVSSSAPLSQDNARQAEQHSDITQQTAASTEISQPASSSAVSSSSGLPQTSTRKPTSEVIKLQVETILQAIDQATNERQSWQLTALPFPKHLVHLPESFISIALPVAEVLRYLKSSVGPHADRNFQALLKQAVKLLAANDTTRLEAAMLTLHSLHIAASTNLASNIELWGEQFLLWSEENKILMREALDLFETMCIPSCKELTNWYFQQALSSKPMVPFSALLGRYTPAYVRKNPKNLTSVLTTLKDHGNPMSCKEFQRVARKIPKPAAQKKRPSVAKTSSFTQMVLKESRKVAYCVGVVGEAMSSADKVVFSGMLDALPKEPSLPEAITFLQYPVQKRRKPN